MSSAESSWLLAWPGAAVIGVANGVLREKTYGARVPFEFGFGRLVAKQPWSELARDYDITQGRTWPFVLAWIVTGPALVRTLRART